jgi:hypothetical protein
MSQVNHYELEVVLKNLKTGETSNRVFLEYAYNIIEAMQQVSITLAAEGLYTVDKILRGGPPLTLVLKENELNIKQAMIRRDP